MLTRKLFIALAIGVSLIGAMWAYHSYENDKYATQMSIYVKGSTIRLRNSIEYFEKEKNFERVAFAAKADLAEMEKNILEVQALADPSTQARTEQLVQYLSASLELRRAIALLELAIIEWGRVVREHSQFLKDWELRSNAPRSNSDPMQDMSRSFEMHGQSNKQGEVVINARQRMEVATKQLVLSRGKAIQVVPDHTLIDSTLVTNFAETVAAVPISNN